MFKAPYYKADGKKGRARALPDTLFDGVVNESAMHQVVKAYLSNQRQGTGSAKSRGEVRGGSRKPWRQKGTGRARQGTIRAVQWEGGGVAFPPIPHSWRQKVPRKVKALARRSALNDRAENDRIIMADLPGGDAPKTKELVGYLASLGTEGKVLILTQGRNERLYLSARNVPNVSVMPFGEESVYDVLWAHTLVIERSALEAEAESDAADESEEEAPKAKASKPKAKAKAKKAEPKPEAEATAESEADEPEAADEPAEDEEEETDDA